MRIGLVGKQGCGKTTIAQQLEAFGYVRYSFACKLKELCTEMFPDIMAQPKVEHRWLLQKVGTDWFRSVNKNVWVDYLIRNIDGEKVVVDDVRFINEAQALREKGFVIVRVERDKALRGAWGYNVEDTHRSELEMEKIEVDFVLRNDGDYPFKEAAAKLLCWLVNQDVEDA